MTDTPATAATPAAEQPGAKPGATVTITLSEPIERDGAAPIATITLRKPRAGELRGLSVSNLVNSDVGSIITVIPRICEPYVHDHEAANLAADDLAEIGGAIVGFFMSPAQKQMIAEMAGIPSTK